MSACCAKANSNFCPKCGAALSTRPLHQLLRFIQGRLAEQHARSERTRRAMALYGVEPGATARYERMLAVSVAKESTIRTWVGALEIAANEEGSVR